MPKRETPRLRSTKDYDLFEMDPINRDLSRKPKLEASMKRHGFVPACPIRVGPKQPSGRYPIRGGHNRFDMAKRLGLPIWFVVDTSGMDIYEAEGDSTSTWKLLDFLVSRAKGGDEACQRTLRFQKQHGLTQGSAISLLAGESAGSCNKGKAVKEGRFRIADDLTHAQDVVDVVDCFRASGIEFAGSAALVAAISSALRVPECDPKTLKHRIMLAPDLLHRRSNREGYLQELEALYNYGARKRLPLAFRASEVARERQPTQPGRGAAARRTKA